MFSVKEELEVIWSANSSCWEYFLPYRLLAT